MISMKVQVLNQDATLSCHLESFPSGTLTVCKASTEYRLTSAANRTVSAVHQYKLISGVPILIAVKLCIDNHHLADNVLISVGEAMILHHFDLQRHDSMYVFLLPCMYFLFIVILHFKGKRLVSLRTASLIIYIIHPMMIVVIRLFSKLLHIQKLFVENSIVHYFAVCLTSVVFSVVLTTMWNKYKPKKAKHTADTDRAYLEIDLNNLEHNVKVLKRAMPQKCELMAVVKAEAYGHGLYEIATHLNKIGVKAFAVATIDEGIKLRQYGVLGEILILGYTAPARAKELRKYDLTQTLIDYKYALLLDKQGYDVMTHIKVDTGMHRLGFDAKDIEKISAVFSMKHIKVSGIYTHLCAADSVDEKDIFFTNVQIESFYNLLNQLKEKGITIPKIHIQSSYGLLNYPELKCDYVRVGVSLYGVLSIRAKLIANPKKLFPNVICGRLSAINPPSIKNMGAKKMPFLV